VEFDDLEKDQDLATSKLPNTEYPSIGKRIMDLTGTTASSQTSNVQPDPSQTTAGNGSSIGSRIIDLTSQAKAPSRIPKQSSTPAPAPPTLPVDPRQQRQILNRLVRTPRPEPPMGISPSGSLMIDMTSQVKAPSRIPRQYESGDHFSNVNTGVIVTNEGGSLTGGYVPNDNSGVTIAAGFDLGKHRLADLQKLGLPKELVAQMSPYLGLTGKAAKDALAKSPLAINKDQAGQIDRAAFNSYLNAAGSAFNDSTDSTTFSKLPWQAQTAIGDVWYNMGDLRDAAPNFWQQVTSGDWESAYRNLMNFTQKDKVLAARARRNAKLLRDAIDVGALPDQ
jgi:hypothetical protein